jgi:hypothetical protein
MLPFFQLSPDLAKVQIDAKGLSSTPSFIPKMTSTGLAPCITSGDIQLLRKEPKQRWHRNFSADGSWGLICNDKGLFPLHTIGVSAPLSHSPDVLHHLTTLICGYLCKEGDSITWDDLRDVDKAMFLLQTKKNVCLLLVALGFSGELKFAVTNSGDPLGL